MWPWTTKPVLSVNFSKLILIHQWKAYLFSFQMMYDLLGQYLAEIEQSLLFILLFIKSNILFLHILFVVHFLFYCTFYSLFLFFYLYIYALVLWYFYIIFIFILLHCPLSGPDLIYISLLIMPCIIYYETNKETLYLVPCIWKSGFWGCKKNLNIEKIIFKVVQMKFSAMHITNQKLSFYIFMVRNVLSIFMEHDLYLIP